MSNSGRGKAWRALAVRSQEGISNGLVPGPFSLRGVTFFRLWSHFSILSIYMYVFVPKKASGVAFVLLQMEEEGRLKGQA